MILHKRAEEITELVKKAKEEISMPDETLAGDISIGAGETDGIRHIVRSAKNLQAEYPLVHFHIVSGDKTTVLEELDRGLIDFALLFGDIDTSKYEYLELPSTDKFGVLMRQDDTLTKKDTITPEDLWGKPLIVSRQSLRDNNLCSLLGCDADRPFSVCAAKRFCAEKGIGLHAPQPGQNQGCQRTDFLYPYQPACFHSNNLIFPIFVRR